MLALPRGGTTAPTTPLLRFMIAYAQPKVNMRAKLLPYANCGARRGGKKGRHLRFLPSLNTRFPCGVAWVQMVGCVSVEKGERQRIFTSVSFATDSQCQIVFCYTCDFI